MGAGGVGSGVIFFCDFVGLYFDLRDLSEKPCAGFSALFRGQGCDAAPPTPPAPKGLALGHPFSCKGGLIAPYRGAFQAPLPPENHSVVRVHPDLHTIASQS